MAKATHQFLVKQGIILPNGSESELIALDGGQYRLISFAREAGGYFIRVYSYPALVLLAEHMNWPGLYAHARARAGYIHIFGQVAPSGSLGDAIGPGTKINYSTISIADPTQISAPTVIYTAPGDRTIWNTSSCSGPHGEVMALEIGGNVRFLYSPSRSLSGPWSEIGNELVLSLSTGAAPRLDYADPYYMIHYLTGTPVQFYTSIAWTKDFLTVEKWNGNDQFTADTVPVAPDQASEIRNTSDVSICQVGAETHIVYMGGNQSLNADGTPTTVIQDVHKGRIGMSVVDYLRLWKPYPFAARHGMSAVDVTIADTRWQGVSEAGTNDIARDLRDWVARGNTIAPA